MVRDIVKDPPHESAPGFVLVFNVNEQKCIAVEKLQLRNQIDFLPFSSFRIRK